jgi:hypothetical protein
MLSKLHYVLDLWFAAWRSLACKGQPIECGINFAAYSRFRDDALRLEDAL